jgi:hypothetical protein
MKMLYYSLKTLDKLDKTEVYKKAEAEYINIGEVSAESEPTPLDSDLAITIESFDPLDPF